MTCSASYTPRDTLLTALRERAREREARMDTVVCDVLPDREEIGWQHVDGILSKFVLPHGIVHPKRYLLKRSLVDLGEGVYDSPTSAARGYLRELGYKSARPGRAKESIEGIMKLTPALPLHSQVKTVSDGYYIDIQRCYFATMMMCGWDTGFHPLRYVTRGRPPVDFPFQASPIARNSLVSMGANHITYKVVPPNWTHEVMSTFNPLYNLSLNALIRDTLHAIGYLAVQEGAIYVQTDGYIAPSPRIARSISQIVQDFGYATRIKGHGFTSVRGTGSYWVGGAKSLLYDDRAGATGTFSAVRDSGKSYRRWLQHEMNNLAATDGALHLVSDIV